VNCRHVNHQVLERMTPEGNLGYADLSASLLENLQEIGNFL